MSEKTSATEKTTFAELLGAVKPIKKPAHTVLFGRKRRPSQQLRRDAQHMRIEKYRQRQEIDENFAAIPATLFAAMGSGKMRHQRIIDLHGFFVDEAVNLLKDALSLRRNHRLCIWLIVHGKGKHSSKYDRAPLKHAVIDLLRRHQGVAAIRAVRDRDLDSGAVAIALYPRYSDL